MSSEALPFEERYWPGLGAYLDYYRRNVEDIEEFWAERARSLVWTRSWDRVLNSDNPPFYRWFEGGRTNINLNALERHGAAGRGRVAYYWIGEDGSRRVLSYDDLSREVNRAAYLLREILGVGKGDTITLYLPMIPELPIFMLASARIGAIHSVVFSGFSSGALADRIVDAGSRILVTADGFPRRGRTINLVDRAREAVAKARELGVEVERIIIVRRMGLGLDLGGREAWLDDLLREVPEKIYVKPMEMESTDIFFILHPIHQWDDW